MDDKKGLIDYPHYNPDDKVVFPPLGPATDERDRQNREGQKRQKEKYSAVYAPDAPTPDPSQTQPGAPDLRSPNTRYLSKDELAEMSPDVQWKERPEV